MEIDLDCQQIWLHVIREDHPPDTSGQNMNDEDIDLPTVDEQSAFGDWLREEMVKQDITIPDLVLKTGITYVGIYNIVKGKTLAPRQETREKIARALNETVPIEVEQQIESDAAPIPGLTWIDFTPSDLQTIPQTGGVYVFYDVTDRPVYVGMSKNNVRARVKDHQTRFWFKEPLVVRGGRCCQSRTAIYVVRLRQYLLSSLVSTHS